MTRPPRQLAVLLLVLAGCSAAVDGVGVQQGPAAAPAARSAAPPPSRVDRPLLLDHRDAGVPGIALPDAIRRALQTDALVLECPGGVDDGRSLFTRDWVGVHRVDLDADGSPEWILNGLHPCLRQQADDHAYWWVYAGEPATGSLRLLARALQGRALEVLPGDRGDLADLRMHLLNGRGEPLQLDLASDGARYVPAGHTEP